MGGKAGPPPAIDGVDWEALIGHLQPSAYRAFRDRLDPILGAVLLVLGLPLLAVLALAIRLDSSGPVLFRQRRGGLYARPFTIVKFRTMRVGAPPFSAKVDADDVMITRVGRLLRASGLDELPQLWNVVRGEMNLIGPRPEQYELLASYEPWQHERHLVKPGVTGWWQVNHRDAVPMGLNTERDLYYVRNQSPALDALILVRTAALPFMAAVQALRRRRRPPEPAAQGPESPRSTLVPAARPAETSERSHSSR